MRGTTRLQDPSLKPTPRCARCGIVKSRAGVGLCRDCTHTDPLWVELIKQEQKREKEAAR